MDLSPNGYNPNFVKSVEQTIRDHRMFQTGDAVLIGVSGGADSIALLDLISDFAPAFSLKLGIAHLNHSLRKAESDHDADFVAALGHSHHIAAYIDKVNVEAYKNQKKLSLEEAARHLRYDFFLKIARQNGFNKIALGHHADDNAELVLMFLLRGAGSLGISGIPPVRKIAGRAIRIVRPLIKMTKPEIISFVNYKKLAYVTDRSNIDLQHLRNRIRLQLMPLLKDAYNPQIVAILNRLASIISAEEKWMTDITNTLFHHVALPSPPQCVSLSISKIKALDAAPQRRIVRRALQNVKGDLRRVSFKHIQTVLKLIEGKIRFKSLDFPDGIQIRCKADEIVFLKAESAPAKKITFEYPVPKPQSVLIKEIGQRIIFSLIDRDQVTDFRRAGQGVDFFDMSSLVFPLTIRNFRPGDHFKPLGMTGTQKLKKFFINQKVPRCERNKCPLLLSREKIIWVAGHRIAESVKVSPTTRSVLKAELLLA